MPVIDNALPKQRAKVRHHAAVLYSDLPTFMVELRQTESMGRMAREAAILTAARSGKVRLATWGELNLDAATWTIRGECMKAGREHVVPLFPPAVALFERVKAHRRDDTEAAIIFPGLKRGKPLSDMTLTKAVRDMGCTETPRGFRSTFRDWVAEQTSWPADLAEAALAHVVSDKTVAAYQRRSVLEKRRELITAWGDYCEGASGNNVFRNIGGRLSKVERSRNARLGVKAANVTRYLLKAANAETGARLHLSRTGRGGDNLQAMRPDVEHRESG